MQKNKLNLRICGIHLLNHYKTVVSHLKESLPTHYPESRTGILVIDHITVVCLVAWPLNESEAGVDLVLIETLLLFICKLLLISMRTALLT